LLARLFTRPANVLVLDEPTNDLDLETLDLLEELLAEFQGTVFVVSHDREFLNRTVTGLLVFEAPGRLVEYTGGYDDWLRQSQAQSSGDKKPAGRAVREAPREKQRERRLSFKEKRELDELPGRIEALELELQEVRDKLSDPDFYRNAGAEAGAVSARLTALEMELESAYARWEELEALEK
ncbi:MAG: ABC transporter ATP-binding protein, partial [Deltaproteobacteria bacterium]|nr:ABC transporter ATP-binding protein [Deltaproteobacteria bacterium]